MRPVRRGDCPLGDNGQPRVFTEYGQARKSLIERMGQYCSYCETQLGTSLAVEHVQPKKARGSVVVNQTFLLTWSNFLLACTNCNSTKGNTPVVLTDYLWPDSDNTFCGYKYSEGGVVAASDGPVKAKAHKMIKLVGLDKTPDTDEASDRRWLNRKEAWDRAVHAKKRLLQCNAIPMREQITDMVKAQGFWSVWMTVFKDDQDMLQRFILALPGTSLDCFDATFLPITRPGGQC